MDLSCLHTDCSGVVWGMTPRGVAGPIKPTSLASRLSSGVYRVIGAPENYRLITELYSTLIGKELNARLLVGSPHLCSGRKPTVEQVLSGVSILSVHDAVHNSWHRIDSKGYNNFLLLRTYQEEGVNDLLEHIFEYHESRAAFRFLGLTCNKLILQLLSAIGDPRWYLNAQRPYRMSRLESYFGLLPVQFHQAWSGSNLMSSCPRAKRTLLVLAIVRALPADSFVFSELGRGGRESGRMLQACRIVLGFVARSWLAGLANSGYLDPNVFFRRAEVRNRYLQQLRD